MRRRTRIQKEDRLRFTLVCLTSLCLLLSAILLHLGREEGEAIPLLSLLPKTDKTVLVLGRDSVGTNTDVMLLCRLDGEEGKGFILQLPRDTYVEREDKGMKLNSLYGRFLAESKGEKEPEKAALQKLTALLSESLGVTIDDFLLLDLAVFRETVDALGGVTVEIPCDLHYEDTEQGLSIHLEQGMQTLDGETAEQFVRFRSGYVRADLGRIDAQKLFLAALMKRVKEGMSLTELVTVGESVLSHTVTSLTVTELPSLLSSALSLELSSVRMATAPGTVTANGCYYVLNREGMTALLAEAFAPTGAGFDTSRLFRGYQNEEVRGLYGKVYREQPMINAEIITEDGIDIAVRGNQ